MLGSRLERLIPVAYSDPFCGAVRVRMCRVRIVWIGNGEVARFRQNHSVVVSSLVVVLASGDPALPVFGSRSQRRLPVAYSEIWYKLRRWLVWY